MKAAAPSRRQRVQMLARGEQLIATKLIVGITVAAFVAIGLSDGTWGASGHAAGNLLLFGPFVHRGEWWRVFTVSLVHDGVAHIFFNMLLLWIIGRILEPGAGPLRFGLLYVVSVAAGSAGALIAQPHVATVGASGGVFGVAAAATLVIQRQGVRFWDTGFGPLLVINLVLDLFLPNISIAAHIGGAVGGLVAAEAMMQSRKVGHPELGLLAATLVGAGAFVLCLAVAKPF